MLKEKIMFTVRVTLWNEVFYENSPEEELVMSEEVYDALVQHLDGYYEEDGSIFYTSDNKISMEVISWKTI